MQIKPANEAACGDLDTVFGTRGPATFCQCQRYKLAPGEAFAKFPVEERRARLQEQTRCGRPGATATSGLVEPFLRLAAGCGRQVVAHRRRHQLGQRRVLCGRILHNVAFGDFVILG